jgi:hypothetical protein
MAKLRIIALDQGATVEAQYNPKEITIDKTVPWQKAPTSTSDQPELTFTSAEGRSVSFELFFDTYKQGTDVHVTHVAGLLALAMVMDPNGAEGKRRPTRVKIVWGNGLPPFEGVIESVGTRYTMFLPSGTPVRATCTVKVKEASRVSFKRPRAMRS